MKKNIDTWTEEHKWTPPINKIVVDPMLGLDIIFPQHAAE